MKNIFKFILILCLFIFASDNCSLAYYNDGYIGPDEFNSPDEYLKVKKIGLCLYIFRKYGHYGVIQEMLPTGKFEGSYKIIIPPIYDDIQKLNSKYLSVCRNGKCGVREWSDTRHSYNHLVVPMEWDFIEEIASEEFKVKRNAQYGVVNSQNELLIPVEMDDIFRVNPTYCYAYLKNGLYGLINISFKIVTEPIFTYVDGIDKYTATGCQETGCGVWNYSGDELFPPVYDWDFMERPSSIPEGYFITEQNGKYGLMDIEERIVLDCQYPYFKSIEPYGVEIETKVNGNKYNAIVNLNTEKYIVQLIYEKAEYWDNYGYYKVKKNGKWGAINSKGELIYPTIYGPLEINRIIKKYPIDTKQIQTVKENKLHQMYLQTMYYLKVNDKKQAKKIMKKLLEQKYEKVYDLIYEYNIDPTI